MRVSKPLSLAIAWMTWAICIATDPLNTIIVTTGLGVPAAASKAFALATSRAGIGSSLT